MSPQLKLQQRDDPLAVGGRRDETGAAPPAPTAPPEVAPRATRTRPQGRRSTGQRAAGAGKTANVGETPTYDDDRLEQTGWRIYETLVAAVRDRAQELSDAGVPTSAAALAAATLHSRLPQSVEEGTEVMRAFRQASAGRARARRSA